MILHRTSYMGGRREREIELLIYDRNHNTTVTPWKNYDELPIHYDPQHNRDIFAECRDEIRLNGDV